MSTREGTNKNPFDIVGGPRCAFIVWDRSRHRAIIGWDYGVSFTLGKQATPNQSEHSVWIDLDQR